MDFSEAMGVASNTVFEAYIVMLSEVYRRSFCKRKRSQQQAKSPDVCVKGLGLLLAIFV